MIRAATAALLVLLTIGITLAPRGAVARAQTFDDSGLEQRTVKAANATIHFDATLGESVEASAIKALTLGLEAVPRITGLTAFRTPVEIYVIDGTERFRDALVKKAGIPVALVAQEISGYAIERNGVMLLFFVADGMDRDEIATAALAHELAHLAVREATQRRPVPQWLNEGYAQWTSYQVLREVNADAAEGFEAIDRGHVSSAIHSEAGLLAWASLATRSRFSQAGTAGWVELAYGQSTLFVDWLAQTYGRSALVHFLQELGRGTAATPAFSRAFGPYAPVEREFRAAIAQLAVSTPKGLHRLTAVNAPAPVFGIVGGAPREPFHAEVVSDGVTVSTRDDLLSQAGFGYVAVSETISSPRGLEIRVSTPSLGSITMRADQTFAPAQPPRAPVQLPIGIWDEINGALTSRKAA